MSDSDDQHGIPLLSFPFDVLDYICELVASHNIHRSSYNRPSASGPIDFGAFFATRRLINTTSPYAVRLVCKALNGIMVRHLFQKVHLRLGWDCLRVWPPLDELSMTTSPSKIFRENAKSLRIGSLIANVEMFREDVHKDDHRNSYLPLDAYDAYPAECKTAQRKQEEYRILVERMKGHLIPAIASFKNVVELRLEIGGLCQEWYTIALARAMSSLQQLAALSLTSCDSWPTAGPFFGRKLTSAICGVKGLQSLELCFCHDEYELLPIDYDDFWRALKASTVRLASLKTNAATRAVLEYAACYSDKLQCISFDSPTIMTPKIEARTALVAYMIKDVLPRHTETLQVLHLPEFYGTLVDLLPLEVPNLFKMASKCNLLASVMIAFPISNVLKTAPGFKQLLDLIPSSLSQLRLYTIQVFTPSVMDLRPPESVMHDVIKNFCPSDTGRTPPFLEVIFRGGDMVIPYTLAPTSNGARYQSTRNTHNIAEYSTHRFEPEVERILAERVESIKLSFDR